jgi:hypothetical protein
MATNLADFGGAAHHVSRQSAARMSQAGRKFSASAAGVFFHRSSPDYGDIP